MKCMGFSIDSPRISWKWKILHGFYWILAVVGVILVLCARGHYTIDILVAYYFTTRLWWIYHTLANNREGRVSLQNYVPLTGINCQILNIPEIRT